MPALIGGFGKTTSNTRRHLERAALRLKRYFMFLKNEELIISSLLTPPTPSLRRSTIDKNNSLNNSSQKSKIPGKFGPYLAGLIEADGTIAVHNKESKVKKYRPQIIVVFSLADKPLAEKLASLTQAGTIYDKKDAGCVLWQIQKKEDVKKIINLINGYMRTPKIEALHRAINWFNQFDNCSIDCLDLDISPIDSNG
jgi:hypothetical protein